MTFLHLPSPPKLIKLHSVTQQLHHLHMQPFNFSTFSQHLWVPFPHVFFLSDITDILYQAVLHMQY